MDFEKYYKTESDGNYAVHFVNKDKLSSQEIREIFSAYGDVLSINGVKNGDTGFRFVKYKTLPEIEQCFNGLKDGSKIELLPEKSKMNEWMNKRSSNQAARMGNSFKKPLNNDRQFNSASSSYNRNLSNIETNFTHMGISNESNRADNFSHNNENFMNHKSTQNMVKDDESRSSVFNRNSSLSSGQRRSSTESNSLDTLEYEKYFRVCKKDKTYTLHFANKKGLDLDEIKELFSSYGNVVAAFVGGDHGGLRFVKYNTLEETIRCIKALQNDDKISLLPHKNKIANEMTSTTICGKQFNSFSNHNETNRQEKLSENEEKPIYNTKTSDRGKFADSNNFSDNTSHSSRQDYKSNAYDIRHRNTDSQMLDEKYLSSRQQNPINNENHNQVMNRKQQETTFYSSKIEADTKMDRDMRNSTPKIMPKLTSDTDVNLKEFETMSQILSDISLNEIKNSSKYIFIPMQEIIVANIDIKYGVHYILHLLEKYSPISSTFMKISSINVRYCRILFKTPQDAVAVEEEFDNFDLAGKKLVVLRTSRVIDETINYYK